MRLELGRNRCEELSCPNTCVQVFPHDYQRALKEAAAKESETVLEVDDKALASGEDALQALRLLAEKGRFPPPPPPISPEVRRCVTGDAATSLT